MRDGVGWYALGPCLGRVLFSIDGKVEALVDDFLAHGEYGNRKYTCRWQEFVSTRKGGRTGILSGESVDVIRDTAMAAATQAVNEERAKRALKG